MTADQPRDPREQTAANTDVELWRGKHDVSDYYADSVHVTVDGRIGFNVAGSVREMTPAEWLAALSELDEARRERDDWRKWAEARLEFRDQRDEAVAQTAALAEALGRALHGWALGSGLGSLGVGTAALWHQLEKAETALREIKGKSDGEAYEWGQDSCPRRLDEVWAIARAYFAEAETGRGEPTA